MGVTLDLRLIDHDRIVVGGLRAVNDAIRLNKPDVLREYLASLPVDVDPEKVDLHTKRLARLREFKAPEIIIQNEERFLERAKGTPYRAENFKDATFDQLRELLSTWCWVNHCYGLDKMWEHLHWFLEPVAGEIYPTCPRWPEVGDPAQSIWTKCMKGAVAYPRDELGEPIVRTLGSPDPGFSGYNPPAMCTLILEALQRTDPAAWEVHIPFRYELYKKDSPDLAEEDINSCIENELSFAREAFPILVSAYTKAVEKAYGVSCEYSL